MQESNDTHEPDGQSDQADVRQAITPQTGGCTRAGGSMNAPRDVSHDEVVVETC